jgi:hypothetical protein
MSDNSYSLRSEAGPIPYWKHHKRAQKSIKFIIRVIKAAADRVNENEGISNDRSIDTNRASRICFVSGEPGAGKSTLYLTLAAMLSSKDENKYALGCPPDIGLDKLQGVVKLLEPLDLEVAVDEGENLLAAVLVRLFRKLDDSGNIHSEKCEGAIKKLEDLATDIGIAWEGNLQARAAALDPDTYSSEVMRTQGARLKVNERLRDALGELAENSCYGCSKGTLFVLPVDDLYLKPSASLQLLRLLRMISIPRLFFLVMGDVNTLEALFIEKSLADWTDVAGSRLFADQSDRLDEALTRARELRARYLRKLLPPGQRTTIEAMDWHEALDLEVGSKTHVERLEKLLEDVKLDPSFSDPADETISLHKFLISPPFSPEENEERQKEREEKERGNDIEKTQSPEKLARKKALRKDRAAYTALQILDATPREMMDLGAALREVIRKRNEGNVTKDDSPILISSVRDIVNLVREEHSFLNEAAQKVLEGVLPTRVYSPEDNNFRMDILGLRIVAPDWQRQDSESLWIRNHRSWDLTVNSQKNDSEKESIKSESEEDIEDAKDPFGKLPPRPAAWFVLLHDLAWNWKPDSITGNLIKSLCEKLNDWELIKNQGFENHKDNSKSKQAFYTKLNKNPDASDYFTGWAIWHNGNTYRHFPMPNFDTFCQLDRFLYVWSCGLDWLEDEKAKNNETIDSNKIIDIWRLASWVIKSNEYEDFSRREPNWFEINLNTFEEKANNLEETWISNREEFFKKVSATNDNTVLNPEKAN